MASAAAWLVILRAAAAREQSMASQEVGGYSPIEDINDPHVTRIANFPVTEYNKPSEAKLKFEKVIKGEAQFVIRINYRLTLSANNGSVSNTSETIVYENLGGVSKKLISFVRFHA